MESGGVEVQSNKSEPSTCLARTVVTPKCSLRATQVWKKKKKKSHLPTPLALGTGLQCKSALFPNPRMRGQCKAVVQAVGRLLCTQLT